MAFHTTLLPPRQTILQSSPRQAASRDFAACRQHQLIFSYFIEYKMPSFLFEVNVQNCLSSHLLSFFIAKSNLEEIACHFLRDGLRVNRQIVYVPFIGVCRCAGVREDKTSYSFSSALTLSPCTENSNARNDFGRTEDICVVNTELIFSGKRQCVCIHKTSSQETRRIYYMDCN